MMTYALGLPAERLWGFKLLAIDFQFLKIFEIFVLQAVQDLLGMATRSQKQRNFKRTRQQSSNTMTKIKPSYKALFKHQKTFRLMLAVKRLSSGASYFVAACF